MCQSPITRRWLPATIKAFCPEPRSYEIDTPEGITYRRTQNHLKPFKSPQKTQTKERYQQHCPNQKRTPITEDSEKIQPHLKRQIKAQNKSTSCV